MYGNYKLIILEIHTFPHIDLKMWGQEERHGEWELTNGVLTALTWLTGDCVRTNFVWGPDWAPGCPDIWPHMTLGGFPWMKLAFESVDSGEQIASQCEWPHPAHLNRAKGWGRGILSLQLCLTWDVGPLLSRVSNSLECKPPSPYTPRPVGSDSSCPPAGLVYNKHIVINRQ